MSRRPHPVWSLIVNVLVVLAFGAIIVACMGWVMLVCAAPSAGLPRCG